MAGKVEDLVRNLETVNIVDELSFANKQLRVNNAEDAKPIVTEIEKTARIVALRLTGNTIGVEGCKAIGQALAKHSELERLLCSDMFTGRLKEEIAPALTGMTSGVREAGARIVELDFSDNAFGPNGVCGLTSFINGPSCANLTVLRLNNNGLGIHGAKMLAESLLNSSGDPVCRLRVFVAGRNRLENEGIRRLAGVFTLMQSLEELAVPQNGIQAPGIEALCAAIAANRGLRIVNLNDNTLAQRGSVAVARALLSLPELSTLNLGDCLLRNDGALQLAESLKKLGDANKKDGLKLRELILDGNEIRESGAVAICQSLSHCFALERVTFDSNEIGEEALERVRSALKNSGRPLSIASFEECVSEDEDEDEDGDGEKDGEEEESEEDEDQDTTRGTNDSSVDESRLQNLSLSSATTERNGDKSIAEQAPRKDTAIVIADPVLTAFVNSLSTLDALDTNLSTDAAQAKQRIRDAEPTALSALLIKVGSLLNKHSKPAEEKRIYTFIDEFARPTLAAKAEQSEWFSQLTNDFLSRLGLIKNEFKIKAEDDLNGHLKVASYVVEKRYVTQAFCHTLKFFLTRSDSPRSDIKGLAVDKLVAEIDKSLK